MRCDAAHRRRIRTAAAFAACAAVAALVAGCDAPKPAGACRSGAAVGYEERMRLLDFGSGVLSALLLQDAVTLLVLSGEFGRLTLEQKREQITNLRSAVAEVLPESIRRAQQGRLAELFVLPALPAAGFAPQMTRCAVGGRWDGEAVAVRRDAPEARVVFLYEIDDGTVGVLVHITGRPGPRGGWLLDHFGVTPVRAQGQDAAFFSARAETAALAGDPYSAYALARMAEHITPRAPRLHFDAAERRGDRARGLRPADVPAWDRDDVRVWTIPAAPGVEAGIVELLDVTAVDVDRGLLFGVSIAGGPDDPPQAVRAHCARAMRGVLTRATEAPRAFAGLWCEVRPRGRPADIPPVEIMPWPKTP